MKATERPCWLSDRDLQKAICPKDKATRKRRAKNKAAAKARATNRR